MPALSIQRKVTIDIVQGFKKLYDKHKISITMSFFKFLSNFKTHLHIAFALRAALILYGDHKVNIKTKDEIGGLPQNLVALILILHASNCTTI